jgi:predicted TPR repeat methyltransferase
MDSEKTIQSADALAKEYDEYVLNRNWSGPEILFGLMHEYLSAGQKLLDIGIGTGLSSQLFRTAGLRIYGVDGSSEMLNICRSKNIATELKQVDLAKEVIPFKSLCFDHIISYAVFHLIGDISNLVGQVSELIKMNGILGFSCALYNSSNPEDFKESGINGLYERINKDSGIKNYRHSKEYVKNILTMNNFSVIKNLEILAFKDTEADREVYFSLFTARKI